MLDFTSNPPKVGAVIQGKSTITSVSFHESGKRCFVADSDHSRIQVIDCLSGKQDRPAVRVEREQIHLLHATHHEDCLLFAGPTGPKHALHYLSLVDNKILRQFRGHQGRVHSISQSPADDSFLSTSWDRTVRLWNLQSAGCLAECKLPETLSTTTTNNSAPPLAVFDSTGLVFGVAAPDTSSSSGGGGHHLHLYDARNHGAGAFAELKVSEEALTTAIWEAAPMAQNAGVVLSSRDQAHWLAREPWTSMQFNASGNQILVGSGGGLSILLDGFEGNIQKVLLSARALGGNSMTMLPPAACCFTGDDKAVLTGSDDGFIDCWHAETGSLMKRLEGHTAPINCLAFNPRYEQFVSSCKDTAVWIWGGPQ